MRDTTDFYDMDEWLKKGGYQGATISFYDYGNGKVYEPFPKQRNVLYGTPVYLKNSFWFLQGNFNSGKITLFKYLPDKIPELIVQFNITDVICIICVLPERIMFTLQARTLSLSATIQIVLNFPRTLMKV